MWHRPDRSFDYSMVDELLKTILEQCDPYLIVIFGSVARGTAKYGSDIDVLVVADTDKVPLRRGVDILNALDIDTSVDLIVLTPEEFREYKGDPTSFTSHILGTGRVVYGTV